MEENIKKIPNRPSERNLVEYITRLNNRSIQKRRETGMTLYTMIAAFIIIFWNLINYIPVFFEKTISIKFLLTVAVLNICFGLIAPILGYLILLTTPSATKIFDKDREQFWLDTFPLLLPFIILTIVNIIGAIMAFKLIFFWGYYMFFSAILILNFVAVFFLNKKKQKFSNLDLPDFTLFNREQRQSAFVGLILHSIIFVTITAVFIAFSTWDKLNLQEVVLIIKLSLSIFGLFVIYLILLNIIQSKNYHEELEIFEEEIYLNNLSNEEIREKLEIQFVGIGIDRWLEKQEKIIKDLLENVYQTSVKLLPKIDAAEKIDKAKYQREIRARVEEINESMSIEVNNFTEYCKNLSKQITILNQWSSITRYERKKTEIFGQYVSNITNEYAQKLTPYQARINALNLIQKQN